MKHPFILILSLLCASTLYGQQKTWSLGECIEAGIRNNLTLRNSHIDVQKKQTTLSLSRSYLLPKLEANFQAIDYLMKPANVTTGTLLGNDFPDDPTWQKIQSMQYGVTAGIQLSVPLYNQTLLAGIKVAETLRNLSSLSHEKAVEDLTIQIGNVYYLAQASLEQQRLLDENIQRMESLCDITEAMYKGGVVLEVDLSRVQINLKSLAAQRDQYATLYEQQLNLLRFLLDLPAEEPFAVVPMPADIHLKQTAGVDPSLPELRLLTTQQELIQKQIKSVRADYIPSLSALWRGGCGRWQASLSTTNEAKRPTMHRSSSICRPSTSAYRVISSASVSPSISMYTRVILCSSSKMTSIASNSNRRRQR